MAATNRKAKGLRHQGPPKASSPKLWIAVVWVGRGDPPPPSLRRTGGFECWVGEKHEVIEWALAAKTRWDPPPYAPTLYRVLVGELTEEARIPMRYELAPIEAFQ